MSSARWPEVRRLLEEAFDVAPAARARWVEERCGADLELAAEVERLLVADARGESGGFLDPRLVAFAHTDAAASDPLASGARVGSFVVARRLGAGGMGIVYLAEQERPRRQVALKVLKPTYSSTSAQRRFFVEAEILARLRHPAIAQIFEAGLLSVGEPPLRWDLPWYAMEYVEGARTLVEHGAALALAERLTLFRGVVLAVHHAHQRGVIHRDLKPANVLVDHAGNAKVIDFGIARIAAPDASLATMHTSAGELLGTLGSMAPEQLGGDPAAVDVRCDVYALGAMLYELACGRPPLDVRGRSLVEATRIVREVEPERAGRVDRSLAGELEWILARALAKDPARRYQSAAELAEDLARHADGRAVLAGPESRAYRLRCFVQRHRVASGLVLLLACSLVGWIASLVLALARATTAEQLAATRADEALREADKYRGIVDVVQTSIAMAARGGKGSEIVLADVLEHVGAALEARTGERAEVVASLLSGVADFCVALDDYERAESLIESARARLAAAGLGGGPEDAQLRAQLVDLELRRGDLQRASALHDEALDAAGGAHASSGADGSDVADQEIMLLRAQGRFVELERRARAEYEAHVEHLGSQNDVTLWYRSALAVALAELGRLDEALEHARASFELERALHGPDHSHCLTQQYSLASMLGNGGQYAEARELLEDALDRVGAAHGPRSALPLQVQLRLGAVLLELGELERGVELLRDVYAGYAELGLESGEDALACLGFQGGGSMALGRLTEAEALLAHACGEAETSVGMEHPLAGFLLAQLGQCHVLQGRAIGRDELARGWGILARRLGADHPRARRVACTIEEMGTRDAR